MLTTPGLKPTEEYRAEYTALAIRDSRREKRAQCSYLLIAYPGGQYGTELHFEGEPLTSFFAERLGGKTVAIYKGGHLVREIA